MCIHLPNVWRVTVMVDNVETGSHEQETYCLCTVCLLRWATRNEEATDRATAPPVEHRRAPIMRRGGHETRSGVAREVKPEKETTI